VTKSELADAVCKLPGIPKKDGADLVDCVIGLIKDTLASGENVKIAGFGKLEVKPKHSRKGRNPQTGEDITILARSVVTFKPSGLLKAGINAAS